MKQYTYIFLLLGWMQCDFRIQPLGYGSRSYLGHFQIQICILPDMGQIWIFRAWTSGRHFLAQDDNFQSNGALVL